MKVDGTELKVSRVEVIRRVFNEKGQSVEEEIQFFYPEEHSAIIRGFTNKK